MNSNNFKSWPFVEARRINASGLVTFETGFGPSGLPHLGTFAEVARTLWVKRAFEYMNDNPTRLIVFSDDRDGLRKIPETLSHVADFYTPYLQMPLNMIPDHDGKFESFSARNNAKLCEFLDSFGFDYEFMSAADVYGAGGFDHTMSLLLSHHDEIVAEVVKTLKEKRAGDYSPILPIHPVTGRVMQVKIDARPDSNTVVWQDPDTLVWYETSVHGGNAKAQWKADWAQRWLALNVNYEMSGKDLIDSVKLSSKICRIMGGTPPVNLTYELFLDEAGEKISKSKGNGITIDQWMEVSSKDALSHFLYKDPRAAKKLHFGLIPQVTDDWNSSLSNADVDSSAWHILAGRNSEDAQSPVTFSMMQNIARITRAESTESILAYVESYVPGASSRDVVIGMAKNALNYVLIEGIDRVERGADAVEYNALITLARYLREQEERLLAICDKKEQAQSIQQVLYDAARDLRIVQDPSNPESPIAKTWFNTIYEVVLGMKEGPRLGQFISIYGISNFADLIESRIYPV